MLRLGLLAALVLAAPAAARTDPWHAKGRELLTRLVAFKSTERHGETPKLVAYLVGELKAAGLKDEQITVVPAGRSLALVVRVPGRDRARKAILFAAHTDVVEADPKDWQRDPFTLVEENGFYFGRGATDDKAGVAQLMTVILRLADAKLTPSRDLVFAFTGDEETTQETTKELALRRKPLIDAEFALNADAGGGTLDEATGKPTIYTIQGGEKTYGDWELTVTNPGGHSSAPRADNAIYELAAALTKLAAHKFPVESNALTVSSLAAAGRNTPGELGRAMRDFAANPVDGPAAERIGREPGLAGQLRTTCVATMLQGGHAPNALPQAATATVNCRIMPGTSLDAVERTLAGVAGPGVKLKRLYSGIESAVSPPRADVTAAITKAVRQDYPGVPVAYAQSSGATDGMYFRAAGIPTYGTTGLFIKDSDSFEHGLNERVGVDSFNRSIDGWWTITRELADPR